MQQYKWDMLPDLLHKINPILERKAEPTLINMDKGQCTIWNSLSTLVCSVITEESFTVHTQGLYLLLKALTSRGEITISQKEENKIEIRCGRHKGTLVMFSKEVPLYSIDWNTGGRIPLPINTQKTFKMIIPFLSADLSNLVLSSAHLKGNYIESTNRQLWLRVTHEKWNFPDTLFPFRAIDLLSIVEGNAMVRIVENMMKIICKDFDCIFPCHDGVFPVMENLITEGDVPIEFTIPFKQLFDTMQTLKEILGEKSQASFYFTGKQLTIKITYIGGESQEVLNYKSDSAEEFSFKIPVIFISTITQNINELTTSLSFKYYKNKCIEWKGSWEDCQITFLSAILAGD